MEKTLRPDFLIIGMERSGTHWVAALLDNHPDIACFPTLPFYNESGEKRVGEVHFFNTLAGIYEEDEEKFTRPFSDFATKYDQVFSDLVPLKGRVSDEELIKMFRERYSEHCDRQRGVKKIVGEATAAYVFHLGLVDSMYPGIKKICITRDPKDKIVSWHFNMLRKGKKEEVDITREFSLDYLEKRVMPEYKALLAYDGFVHCMTYEALSEYTKDAAAKMVRYLDMPVSDAILAHMTDEASFAKQTARDGHSAGRERGEENAKSGFRKGVVGDWKNYINEDLAQEIDKRTASARAEVIRKFNILEGKRD